MTYTLSDDVHVHYTRAHSASLNGFMNIFAFRRVAELGLTTASGDILDEARQMTISIFTDPEYDDVFKDKEGFIESAGGVETLATDRASQQQEVFRRAIDAASLVFAHSILDNVAYEFCRIAVQLEPSYYEDRLGERKIKLKDLKDSSYDDTLHAKIEGALKELEKESLLKKTDVLLSICQPDDEFAPITDYKFDRDRLEELDQTRHRVVHDQVVENSLPNGNDDIWFLMSSSNYLMTLLNMRFDLKIGEMEFIKGKAQS